MLRDPMGQLNGNEITLNSIVKNSVKILLYN